MGASHSSPASSTRPTPIRTTTADDLSTAIPHQPPTSASRPSPFRRLAPPSLTRRDSKRSHASSSRGRSPDKRARNAGPELERGDEGGINSDGPLSAGSRPLENDPSITLEPPMTYPQPGPSAPPLPIRNSWRRSATSQSIPRTRPPLTSTSTTIRSINRLSSFFGLSTPSTSTASLFPTPLPPSTPLISPFAPSNLTITQSRIDQLRNQLTEIEDANNARSDAAIADIEEQMSAARVDLDRTERQLDDARQGLRNLQDEPGVAAGGEADAHTATGTQGVADVLGGAGAGGRIPTGAVLVIQGLAQAQVPSGNGSSGVSENEYGEEPSDTGERRGRGFFPRRRRAAANDEVETQARMIGGLLTVAAAATASTLLSPTGQPPTPHRGSGSIMSRFLNRNRPQPAADTDNVEEALGEYLNQVIRNHGRISDAVSVGEDEDMGDAAVAFRTFLEGLQGDLLASVREFVNGGSGGQDRPETPISESSPTVIERTGESEDMDYGERQRPTIETPAPTDMLGITTDSVPTLEAPQVEVDATTGQGGMTSVPQTVPTTVPEYHRQAGQTLPGSTTSSITGVTGGRDGQPRRLNFFRAHVFPPRSSTTSPSAPATSTSDSSSNTPPTFPAGATIRDTAQSPPTPTNETETEPAPEMVPCIFIGVRSISHAPGMSTEDLVRHPSFPFNEGEVPEADPSTIVASTSPAVNDDVQDTSPSPASPPPLSRSHSTPTTSTQTPLIRSLTPPSTSTSTPPNPTSPRPNLRSRLLSRFRRNSTSSTLRHRLSPTASNANNTYLVYVIGGNYPSNHPILRIPSLITGAPLSDEEMNMIGEMMGQVKPPTVSREGIEKAGLRVVKGEEMRKLGDEGVVLDSCVERCLICLGDYEEGEECRVLKCRHGYHKECVDQWLSQGRNSCPACRSEAVDSKTAPSSGTAPTNSTTEVNMESGPSDHHEV